MPITTTETSFDGLKITSVSYSILEAARSASLLTVGDLYLITDKGDAGIIVDVSAPNRISLRAKGLFLVPDFQNIGTYTTTPLAKATNRGVWSLSQQTGAPFVDGDIVFWGGIMYQVIDDALFDTNSPDLNASAYEALTKNVTNGYILEADAIIYNFVDDSITERRDKRRNITGLIDNFQWGNDEVYGNKDINSTLYCINQRGRLRNNTFEGSSDIIVDETFTNILQRNYFNGATVYFNAATQNTIEACIFSNISTITISTNVGYYNKQIDAIHSTFDAYLDMNDGAVFSANRLTIPLVLDFIGQFTLVGNTGQTISKIRELPIGHRVSRFYVEAGLNQNFQHTAVATAIADELCADAVSLNVIVGRADGADFIEYERSGIINVRTNIVKLA